MKLIPGQVIYVRPIAKAKGGRPAVILAESNDPFTVEVVYLSEVDGTPARPHQVTLSARDGLRECVAECGKINTIYVKRLEDEEVLCTLSQEELERIRYKCAQGIGYVTEAE